ncbi:MAG TPA: hypothetical protein VFA68_17075 [Terriglobales bacterium]|nr:hypothetical protein [Terriglobales bacterium]
MAVARALSVPSPTLSLSLQSTIPRTRVLAWHNKALYAASGYDLRRADVDSGWAWSNVAHYRPGCLRAMSSKSPLLHRFFRDGFHALTVLSSGHIVAAVPNAIVRLQPGEPEFQISFRIRRGTRPLHIALTPADKLYWGEYFDNPARDEVHIYASSDRGGHWDVAYTFPKGAIRHVHNIVYDRWEDCLWILTGDEQHECRILRASPDLGSVEIVLSGNQQARAVAFVPRADALYFASDTPFEQNHIYRLERAGQLSRVADLSSSSIYGCAVGQAVFFTTMVEPSAMNLDRHSRVFASADTNHWENILSWKKDKFSLRFFQYGNIILPDGENDSEFLALSAVAVEDHDLQTTVWRIEGNSA